MLNDREDRWYGELPASWTTPRLKAYVDQVSNSEFIADSSIHDSVYIALEHVESWSGRVNPSQEIPTNSTLKRFEPDDVLFGKLRPYLAKVTRVKQRGVCVGDFFVFRVRRGLTSRYLEHLLRAQPTISWIDSSTFGAKMPRTDWHFVGNTRIPLPPVTVQTEIASFLDSATSQIDSLIRAIERHVALLFEQQQTLLNHVVTGKIDVEKGRPYRKYRDAYSGWQCPIPEHWSILKLKVWLEINRHTLSEDTDPDYDFDYVDISAVGAGQLLAEPQKLKFRYAPSRARRVVKSGDTILSTVRTYLKAVWYVDRSDTDLIVSTGFAVLRPRFGNIVKICWLLMSIRLIHKQRFCAIGRSRISCYS